MGILMGTMSGAPINELVAIVSKIDASKLDEFQKEFPHLAEELRVGRIGGAPEDSSAYDVDRAEVAARSLTSVANRAATELIRIHARMKSARRRRLIAQVLTLVGSSGVLGSLALNNSTLAIATSVLTLLASIGAVLAEYSERLVSPGKGDIYEAFEQASSAGFKARRLADDLRLAVSHKVAPTDLLVLITNANQLAEELHGWAVKMSGSG